MEQKLRMASLCVQAGYKAKNGEPIELPIVQSTTFKYDDSDEMAKLFDLEKEGYFYTRLQNPTNDAVAAKIAALEGGVGCVLTSSGQAANIRRSSLLLLGLSCVYFKWRQEHNNCHEYDAHFFN